MSNAITTEGAAAAMKTRRDCENKLNREESATMDRIHLRGKNGGRVPRWYNAALTHTK